jgi:hypothetical protein
LERPQNSPTFGDETETDVVRLGMLARVFQDHDPLCADELHASQVDYNPATGPSVELAVESRAELRRRSRIDLAADPYDHTVLTVIERHTDGPFRQPPVVPRCAGSRLPVVRFVRSRRIYETRRRTYPRSP